MTVSNPTHYWSLSTYGQYEDTAPDGSADGSATNPPTHSTVGKIRGAYDFDGTNDYINMGSMTLSLSAVSVSVWLYWGGDTADNRHIIYWYPTDAISLYIRPASSNKLRWDFVLDGTTHTLESNSAISSSGWTHAVITWDGSTAKMYINGSAQTTTASATGTLNGTDDFGIGMNLDSNNYFDGKICEVSFFDSALSSTDVSDLYGSGTAPLFWNQITETWESQDSLRDSLIAAYNFNGDAKDWVGGHDGTVSGATVIQSGKSAQGYSFDGSNDYISVPASIDTNYSISMWINMTSLPSSGNSYELTSGGTNKYAANARIYNNSGTMSIGFVVDTSDSYDHVSYSFSTNTWYHITIIKDGSYKKLYVNGSNVMNKTYVGTAQTDTSFNIGRRSDGIDYFYGKIDEIYVWNVALDSTQVSTLYNSGTGKVFDKETQTFIDGDETRIGQVAYYKADSSSDFLDETIANNDGTISGATYTSSGKINGARDFDGSNDYVSNTTFPSLGSSFTWSAWVKFDDVSTTPQRILYFNDGSSAEYGFISLYDNGGSNQIQLRVYDDSSATDVLSGFTPSTGVWYHVVGVVDNSAGTIKLYVNNDLKNSASRTINWSDNSDFYIGADNAPSSYFNGLIDEVGIWNKALSSTEVSTLYNSGNGLQYPYSTTEEAVIDDALFFGVNF